MLRAVTFNFGPNGFDSRLEVESQTMTLFVGPNNSGKSLVLRELRVYAESGRTTGRKIIDRLELDFPTRSEAESLLRARAVVPPLGTNLPEGHVRVAKTVPSSGSVVAHDVNEQYMLTQIDSGYNRQHAGEKNFDPWEQIFPQFVGLYTVALDGKTRFALTEQRTAGDLQLAPQNHLAALFQNDLAREKVRGITQDAFGLFFVLDPTNLGNLRIRMSLRAPLDSQEEQSVDQRARDFHAAATDIQELSDGIKAFTGLIAALISSDYRVILVDEPEAFLHPPLARKLGARMTSLAAERNAHVFASTHSAEFTMGCIESGRKVNIVRLTHEPGKSTARLLAASKLVPLMRDPLLRSTGVMSALFHAGAVVCEADSDRSFYQEISHRLVGAGRQGVRDSVFLNAQNKQTIRRIVEPLRSMGIPAAAVVDFDILKRGDLTDLLKSCFAPEPVVHSLGILRGDIEAGAKARGLDLGKGIAQLVGAELAACKNLVAQLEAYGVFVVPVGELEGWLASLGVVANKSEWLSRMFERMGSDPGAATFVHPSSDDVWEFVERIAAWVANPNRLGIPES